MGIDGSADAFNTVVMLQRCSGVSLSSCGIYGAWIEGNSPNTAAPGVSIQSLGTAVTTSDITLSAVGITNCSNAVVCSDPVDRIMVNGIQVKQCYSGISLTGGTSGPSNVQINTSEFRDISSNALYVSSQNRGITSLNNQYIDVGEVTGGPAIYWASGTDSCSSIGDIFSANTRATRIHNGNPSHNIIFDAQQPEVTVNKPTTMATTLLNGQTNSQTGITFSLTGITTFFAQIQYSINMNAYRRSGTLTITSDGTTAELIDSSVELNTSASVLFDVSVSSGNLSIIYSSTGSTVGAMNYIYTNWAL
jgi:hypothetical protein